MKAVQSLEIIGGALCLDFANTITSRVENGFDYLAEYTDLLDWAFLVAILPAQQAARLQEQAQREPERAQQALYNALLLRDLLHRIFSQIARQLKPGEQDLATFVNAWGEAISQGYLVRTEALYDLDWEKSQAFTGLLWPVIHSAGQLLTSTELAQVKECPGCGWLFVDRSKNQSRRWCSMNTCGVSDKMRRYYRRTKGR